MKAAVPIVALALPLVLFGSIGESRAQGDNHGAGHREVTSPRGAGDAQPGHGDAPEPPEIPRSAGTFIDAVGLVRIPGPVGTRLERETDSLRGDWETVCTAPCVAQVSTAFNYRVARWDMKSSKGFSLRVDEGQMEELYVNGASYVLWGLGWAALGTGATATFYGVFLELISATNDSLGIPKVTTDPALGWILIGAGVAVAVGGLVLVLTNRHTTVTQDVVGVTLAPAPAAATAPPMPRFGAVEISAPFARTPLAFGFSIASLRF